MIGLINNCADFRSRYNLQGWRAGNTPEASAPSLDQKKELLRSMLNDACIDNKVKEFYRPKDEAGSRKSQLTETKQANSYWTDLDAACKAVHTLNTSTCLTGRKVADERSVTITDVYQRFVGSSCVYVRARCLRPCLGYAAAQ